MQLLFCYYSVDLCSDNGTKQRNNVLILFSGTIELKILVRDYYTLPFMKDCIKTLLYANYMYKLDFISRYWKIKPKESIKDLNTLLCLSRTHHSLWMRLGLIEEPETFRRALVVMLGAYIYVNYASINKIET